MEASSDLIPAEETAAEPPVSEEHNAGHALSNEVIDAAAERRDKLERLLRRGVRKFVGDLPNVLAAQDKRAVHDLRVWSRRLQQILVALCGDKPSRQVRAMRTALKRTRRALGPWRNHDVVLETLIRLERRARSAERRQAWKIVSEAAVAERKREVRRARKRLMKLDIFGLIEAVESLIADSPNGSRATIDASFWGAMTAAFDEWRTALSAAVKSMSPDDIHALRICTKRLRYRIELARELGVEETGSLLTWCRRLQNELGRWRDRLELERVVARTLADPDLLISQPRVGIILLSELDRVQRMAARAMHREILAVEGGSGLPKLEAWLRGHLDGRANAVGGQ